MYIKMCDYLMHLIVKTFGCDVYLNAVISLGLYVTIAPSMIGGVVLMLCYGFLTGLLGFMGIFIILWVTILLVSYVLSKL